MSKRINIGSGAPWEEIVGYSRAVRTGNLIEVAGTAAVEGDEVIGLNDMYAQTKFILQKIEKAINQAGGQMSDVVRTRIYITDITKWELAGRAHGEFFKDVKPVTSMVEVSRLIRPELLIEIEATAIADSAI